MPITRCITHPILSPLSRAVTEAGGGGAFIETWANLSGWVTPVTPGIQVSGGKLYSTGTGGAGSGANHAFETPTGTNARAVFVLNGVVPASGGVMIGVSSDAVGATPTAGGAAAYAIYYSSSGWREISSGVNTAISGAPSLRATTYVVTVVVDELWITIVARSADNTDEIRCRRARSGFSVNNLYIFNSSSQGLTGANVGMVGARHSFGLVTPRAGVEDVAATVHWSGDGVNNFKLELPPNYSQSNPPPLCVAFHGNSTDEHVMSDNSNQKSVNTALLAAGYAVLSYTYIANKQTWGAQASLDACTAAYQYFTGRYAFGRKVLYGNSMGSLESLLVLAADSIPDVRAWAGTHSATNLLDNYNNATFTAIIKTAYGIAGDGSDYAAKTAGHDPNLMAPAAFNGVPMWLLYSTDDTTVSPANNSQSFITLVTGSNTVTAQTTTGGHSAVISPFTASLISFYNAAIA